MNQCPKEYRRNIKAEIKRVLGIIAVAWLLEFILIVLFCLDCFH